jgi:hypothetical protein
VSLDASALMSSLLVGRRSCPRETLLELILIVALGTVEYFADIEVVEVLNYRQLKVPFFIDYHVFNWLPPVIITERAQLSF